MLYEHQCRYCKTYVCDSVAFHYGKQGHAHFKCWLNSHGIEGWRKLNKYQRASFPAMLLAAAGAGWHEIEPLITA